MDELSLSSAELKSLTLTFLILSYNYKLPLFQTTLALHTTAQFTVRNDRTVLANVANTLEYTVKVQCVRQAFDHILLDVTKQQWLKTTGKNNVSRNEMNFPKV